MTPSDQLVLFSEAQARALTDEVKADAAALWAKLLRLYEGGAHTVLGYSSWANYCAAEFDYGRRTAYRLLDAAWAADIVSNWTLPPPTNEAQARELVPLKEDEQAVVEVWRDLRAKHGDNVTAAKVRDAVDTRLRVDRLYEEGAIRRATTLDHNRELVRRAPRLADLNERYPTIVLDPPWDWGDENDVDQFGRARPTYATMPLEEIKAQPIPERAEPNAHLYLWITNRSLPKGFALLE